MHSGCSWLKFFRRASVVFGATSHSAAASSRFWRMMWIRTRARGHRKPWTRYVGMLAECCSIRQRPGCSQCLLSRVWRRQKRRAALLGGRRTLEKRKARTARGQWHKMPRARGLASDRVTVFVRRGPMQRTRCRHTDGGTRVETVECGVTQPR